jgi:thiamine-monophosphate kinase
MLADQVIQRSGAQVGDNIYVSGTLGDSALALALLQRGSAPDPYLAQRHHTPTPRLQLGQQLAQRRLVSAMIDVSDGLCADLGHILDKSHCGALIDWSKIPISPVARAYLLHHPEDEELVLHGGEDYELLFCAPPQHSAALADIAQQLQLNLTKIGTIQDFACGLQQLDGNGQRHSIQTQGFNHFG